MCTRLSSQMASKLLQNSLLGGGAGWTKLIYLIWYPAVCCLNYQNYSIIEDRIYSVYVYRDKTTFDNKLIKYQYENDNAKHSIAVMCKRTCDKKNCRSIHVLRKDLPQLVQIHHPQTGIDGVCAKKNGERELEIEVQLYCK